MSIYSLISISKKTTSHKKMKKTTHLYSLRRQTTLFLYDDSYDDSNLGPRLYYDDSLQKNLNEEKKKSK